MPNQLTNLGLETKTITEIIDAILSQLMAPNVYGPDINVDQDSPDGQMVNIYAQAARDILELLTDVYNSFAVDNAYGTVLDQRVALNGVERKGGTFTLQPVSITVDRAVTLAGLDDDIDNQAGTGFTVKDDAGNEFILAATTVFAEAGTQSLSFRAKNVGRVEVLPNTITQQVTVTLGVTAINNPLAPTQIGEDEESDVQLKLRRARSFAKASQSPADAILAELLAVYLVTDAKIEENDTGSAFGDGLEAHTIWCVVEGGTDADVAQAIYAKKAPGCGLHGAEEVAVVRADGSNYVVKFDRPLTTRLYVEFTIIPKTAGLSFDTDLIAEELAAALNFKLYQKASVGDIVVAMLNIEPNAILTNVKLSLDAGVTPEDVLTPDDVQHKFTVAKADIDITV